MTWPFRRNSRAKKPLTARRIVVWALIIGALVGTIDITRPFEDMFRGARYWVRERPADGKTVVLAFDDRALAKVGSVFYSRRYDAQAVDRLLAMGAKRVFFDESFKTSIDEVGDKAFADALRRHPGKIFLGTATFPDRKTGEPLPSLPNPMFRDLAPARSFLVRVAPFGLSEMLPYGEQQGSHNVPSISSEISGVRGPPGKTYLPDWSIDVDTVPTISMADLLEGKVPASVVAGRDVIWGDTTSVSDDIAHIAGKGWFPGVYDHVIGSQTLRERPPISIGFVPPLLVLAGILLLIVRTRSTTTARWLMIGTTICAVFVPLVLDSLHIVASFVPGFLAFGIAVYRLAALRDVKDAQRLNASTLLPTLSVLREHPLAASRPIVAMRVRNYAAVGASFPEAVESELITEIARRLTLPGQTNIFYQAEDVLYWLGPDLAKTELEGHIAGLARLMESLFVIRGRKIDIHVAFGVDIDVSRPVANRIGRALLAADTAALKHQPFMFNMTDNDEESAWELSLMSELDAAIDNGDIWVAFQPQFELKTDRICGAEALVRWQHPTRGAISPEAFILSAEAHNRIGKLTFHVLELATKAARQIVANNPQFRLSVNISANLMETPDLPAQIVEVLSRTGFPATNLTLEVTESAPFSEHPSVASNLAGIAALGIDLSIDDYGTGNATLEYFRTVPCQEIKIDRRFVTDIADSNGDMLLVESTIELAHGMGRRVIAEGIEEPETLELLRAIGCDIAQGFYLAKPMRIEALEALLKVNSRIRAA